MSKMKYYVPEKGVNMNQKHTVLYTFQYEDAFAYIFTIVTGNVSGGSVMEKDFDCGLLALDHAFTKKYVNFHSDDDKGSTCREVEGVIFHYPNGDTIIIELEYCSAYLVGIQIIDYER